MAVLNTARAVLKDVETRKQVHVIKAELGKLGKDFDRFDTRMKKLADNIRLAHENAQDVHVSSQKISRRFSQIEKVELKEDPNDLLEFEEQIALLRYAGAGFSFPARWIQKFLIHFQGTGKGLQ